MSSRHYETQAVATGTMDKPPLISVIMPAYNAGSYIREAIDSILNQSEQDFELIIINDGSNDDTEAVVQSCASEKIKYHSSPANLGISEASNRAIEMARGEYIAIADADDIHHPQRLEIQANYLETHPQVGVVGAKLKSFRDAPPTLGNIRSQQIKAALNPAQVRAISVWGGRAVIHGVAMIRKKCLSQHHISYDINLPYSMDMDVCQRLGLATDAVVLNCVLLLYRMHTGSTSANHSLNDKYYTRVMVRFWKNHFDMDVSTIFNGSGYVRDTDNYKQLNRVVEIIIRIKINDPQYDTEELHKSAALYLYETLRKFERQSNNYDAIYAAYQETELLRHISINRKLRFHIKYLLPGLFRNKAETNCKYNRALVSVVMSAYNAEAYLKEAMDSVLGQTHKNLEFIIINDGSKDGTVDIIRQYKDERIHFIDSDENRGLTKRRNELFSLAKGKYIALMDADDICMPERLQRQVEYMEQHPEVGICGARVFSLDQKTGRQRINKKPPLGHAECFARLVDNPCFSAPTVMMRTSAMPPGALFDEKYRHAEDYKAWTDLAMQGVVMGNLPDVLLLYRFHGGNVSVVHRQKQREEHQKNQQRFVNYLLGKDIVHSHQKEIAWLIYGDGTITLDKLAALHNALSVQQRRIFRQLFRMGIRQGIGRLSGQGWQKASLWLAGYFIRYKFKRSLS